MTGAGGRPPAEPDATPDTARVSLGPLRTTGRMTTVDEAFVAAAPERVFGVVRDVERWPQHLTHYRWVRVRHRDGAGGGIVEMAAYRPFGPFNWPTWWLSEMEVVPEVPAVRFRHIAGITRGMDVEWRLERTDRGTHIRLVHVWDGPAWPAIGGAAARLVIGPVFVHGIASRTIAGLARAAERDR